MNQIYESLYEMVGIPVESLIVDEMVRGAIATKSMKWTNGSKICFHKYAGRGQQAHAPIRNFIG